MCGACKFATCSLAFLGIHFTRKIDPAFIIIVFLLALVAAFGLVAMLYMPVVYLRDVILFTAVYGTAIYILLCEVLLRGGAKWLTDKRGEKWVKELEYLYLGLGVVGILGSVNKIDQINGRFSKADLLAPVVLITAIVIRLIKTRAEIGGWNKPEFK